MKYNNNMMEEKIWNMDDRFTNRISDRLDELDRATTIADQFLRYRLLRVIYMGTSFKFSEQSNKTFNEEFEKIKNNLKTFDNSRSITSRQHNSTIISNVEEMVDKLTFDLIKALYDADLICLKKTQKKIEPTTNWN